MSENWKPSQIELNVLLTIKAGKVSTQRGLHDTEIIKRVRKAYPEVYSKEELQDAITVLKGQRYLDKIVHSTSMPAQKDRWSGKVTVPASTHRVEMYNLSDKAILFLREASSAEQEAPTIQMYSQDSPYSVRRLFEVMFGEAERSIEIIDNYIGKRTLDYILAAKDKGIPVRIITSNYEEKGFDEALPDFEKEFGGEFEIKVKQGAFHGRIIIVDGSAHLLDHSIKDFGSKPSSIVRVEEPAINDLCVGLFESNWN